MLLSPINKSVVTNLVFGWVTLTEVSKSSSVKSLADVKTSPRLELHVFHQSDVEVACSFITACKDIDTVVWQFLERKN